MLYGLSRWWSLVTCCIVACCALRVSGQAVDPASAAIIAVEPSQGRLVPEWRADGSHFDLDLPISAKALELRFSVAPGARLRVNGKAIDASVPWRSSELVRAETGFVVQVERGTATRTYELNVTRGRLPITLQAKSPGVTEFGARVALSQNTLAVAGVASSGGRQIEIFKLSNGDWAHQHSLTVPECPTQSTHVSLSIDGPVLVLGCSHDPADGNERAGGAFVFAHVNGAWLGPTPLRAANGKEGEFFGESVAVSGETIVVGAPFANPSNERGETVQGAGVVYVFKRNGGSWQQQARLSAKDAAEGDGLGAAVAAYGDTLAASAPFEDSVQAGVNRNGRDDHAPDSGAVYVFVRRGGRWTQQAYLKAKRPDPSITPQWGGDQFGGGDSLAGPSLALWADTLAIGAPGEDWWRDPRANDPQERYVSDAGAVYIFKRRDGFWSQDERVVPSGFDSGGNFGMSVALQGERLVVGAWQHLAVGVGLNPPDPSALVAPAGAAFGFKRSAHGFIEVARMGAATPAPGARFGWSVAVSEQATVVAAPSVIPGEVAAFP